MSDPIHEIDELAGGLRTVELEAESYLASIGDAMVRPPVMPHDFDLIARVTLELGARLTGGSASV